MRYSMRAGKALRSSFTLIELLIVIAIIALLVSLTASAIIRYITTQQQKNTEATISKLDGELSKQYAEVIKAADIEPVCVTANFLANGDPYIARVIHRKLRLKQEFPMTYFEALYPTYPNAPDSTLPPIQEYVRKLATANITSISPQAQPNWVPKQDEGENSACLAMALQRSRGGKGTNLEDLLGPGVIGATSNPANPSLPIINDSWGSPIVFYRWATGNSEVDSSGPPRQSLGRSPREDTQDPEGKLQDPTWQSTPVSGQLTLGQMFEATCHLVSNSNGTYAYYLPPIIASGGPNQKLGIMADPPNVANPPQVPPPPRAPNPMTIANANEANDNLYNYRLRLGGKGD